jgi:hypothetical protein
MAWTKEAAKSDLEYSYLADLYKQFPSKEILKDGKATGNFRTSVGRLIYYDLFRPNRPKDEPNQELKFSATLAFLPEDDVKALKAAAMAVAKEKWGDKVSSLNIRWPFRKQAEKDKPGFLAEGVYINATAKQDRKPEVVNRATGFKPIENEADLYRGCWGMMTVRPYAYDQKGNKGVSFGLVNFVKICDDLPLAAGSIRASDAYADMMGDTSSASADGDTDYSGLMD